MLGLSITAIGLRPLSDCIEIFQTLQPELGLEFLELAIGSPCPVDFAYPDVPLVLHDHCLYDRGMRRRLDPLRPKSWKPYADFIATHAVAAVSLHPPLQRTVDRPTLERSLHQMQQALGIPVYLEVMPAPEYWCSSQATLLDWPLLLDVSHVLIWHGGDRIATIETCDRLLQTDSVGAIHLSHNDGQADRHDLIPAEIWFADRIPAWREKYLVTYESLPIGQSQFERLDKRRQAIPQLAAEFG
jgi:hypothetical protein